MSRPSKEKQEIQSAGKMDTHRFDAFRSRKAQREEIVVNYYFGDMGRFPVLSDSEFSDEFAAYETGKNAEEILGAYSARKIELSDDELKIVYQQWEDGKVAGNRIVRANLRLVIKYAKRKLGQGMDFIDLIQEGNTGLMRALEKYDAAKGKFSTYAVWWIRQAINRAIAEKGTVVQYPEKLLTQYKKWLEKFILFSQEMGYEPSLEEMEASDDWEYTNYQLMMFLQMKQGFISLDTTYGDDDSEFGDMVGGFSTPVPMQVEQGMLSAELMKLVQRLPENERLAVMYYSGFIDGETWSFEDIGQQYKKKVSREQARKFYVQGIGKLKLWGSLNNLDEFLDSFDE